MAPHPTSLPCAVALPPTRYRDATTPSPCWGPHFIKQERLMLSNYTSRPCLYPAATMSDDMLSALAPPLHCASILQPATPPQVVAFESWTISAPICLNRFTLAESHKPNLGTCVCVFTFSSSAYSTDPGHRNRFFDPASEFLSTHWWSQNPACQRCFYKPLTNCHPASGFLKYSATNRPILFFYIEISCWIL